jgi:ubiquinone/menaquinone biosynthesis C-methylase UbiE
MIRDYLRNKYGQFMFHARLPAPVRHADWGRMTVLKIGGRTALDGRMAGAKKMICVDISDTYNNSTNVVDIKADAHSLPMLPGESVDFVASSHTIEHLTNPLKALREWKRILKRGGMMYASIPYYKKTFDHRRPVTALEHLIDDYDKNTGLDDTTHTEEFLKNYDVSKDLVYRDYDSWHANYLTNPGIYTHYHVFDLELVRRMMAHLGFQPIKLFYSGISIEYYGRKI